MNTNPYSKNTAYKKTQVETASPEALILMLYDGAIKFMCQAEVAFEEQNIEQISNLLLRIQAIFAELMTALDKEKGGEIADNLERLYVFFLEKLGDANVRKDPAPMLEIKPLVQNLRNTWELAMQKHQNSVQVNNPPRPRLNVAV
ncbi:MAG: Flagellar biosynthesis protein FliS [Candidatus Rifleibacterium amylolyticum]|nr:MAG: Flagellar biosynthesis protein FliS [Candidatus Rifleibacterium amylolyticum]NLF96933.1 flagellar export chaperone FliS [Candidatus Riflebacteria bacterium]